MRWYNAKRMQSSIRYTVASLLLAAFCMLGGVFAFVHAQGVSDEDNQEQEEIEERREELRNELENINEQINKQQNTLNNLRGERRSLQRDIDILNAEIRQAELRIQKLTISIGELSEDISSQEKTIEELNAELEREKESLAQLLRKQQEIDNVSLAEVMLSNENFSEFFRDVDAFASLNEGLQESFSRIRRLKAQARDEKATLQSQQEEQMNVRAQVRAERRSIESKKAELAELVAIKKSQERSYEDLIAQRQQRAREIRAALFELRQARAIEFGDALAYAREASRKTGVRPAFILGVLRQESNIGENVGQCYLRNRQTGGGVGKNTGRQFADVMKPSRDVQPFLAITEELGLDWQSTPVSCPQSYGYGGAMGPSQFIPSTWGRPSNPNGYGNRVANALGIDTASPWEPKHAFMATALFLRDLGAGAGTYSAEREAAARYFAGGNWRSRGLGYAESVLSHAEDIQNNMIDPIDAAEG